MWSISAGPGSTIATLPLPRIYVPVPWKVKGPGLLATTRRISGVTFFGSP
jgi:hypothetical protein